jgi:hypothetical protein
MTTQPQVYSEFTITSGRLCYGTLNNIYHGASSPVQEFPTSVERRQGGTVHSQVFEFNITAKNGTWNAFQLVEKNTDLVRAWFVSHSEVEPVREIDKILRVAGSPYEPDFGSKFNDDNTVAEAVLLLNRYDWGHYDRRGQEDVTDADADDDNMTESAIFAGAGLVDFKDAKEEIQQWQKKKSCDRDTRPSGVWMHIPHGEYMFGRFGFDDGRTAASSFLFFTTYTSFTRTTFAGLTQTLRVEETCEERFQRHLSEGHDYEGFDTLKMMTSWELPSEVSTPKSEYLGPYDSSEYLLTSEDIDAVRVRPGVTANVFAKPWKEPCWILLNEMLLSYLEHFVAPASSCDTLNAAATDLFSNRSGDNIVNQCLYGFMMNPHTETVQGFHNGEVERKIKSFLTPRSGDNSLIRDDKFNAGIRACIVFLLSELLEMTRNTGKDCGRSQIVPVDIRIAVCNYVNLKLFFDHSRVFWEGSQ